MLNVIAILGQAHEETNAKEDLYPHLSELIVGAIAFAILFFFFAKWVFPRMNKTLEERRQRIQGEMERAEQARLEADRVANEYRERLGNAQQEANRIIEEARRTADQLRRDLTARAEQENQAILARAQEEIRAERDRVFQELKAQVGELSVQLAGRIVGESLDRDRHMRLVDEYLREVATVAPTTGDGGGASAPSQGGGPGGALGTSGQEGNPSGG